MRLTDDQLRAFDELGYLFLPDVFSAEEAALLRAEADTVYALDREEWIARRDFTPIDPLPDDCLLELVRSRAGAAE